MKIINKSKITSFFNFKLKLIVLSSLLFSQLSLSEIFLYQNSRGANSLMTNIAHADSVDAWYDAGYLYRKKITIDHTKIPNTDQTNFPVLISQTDVSLKTLGNGGKVRNASGYDIIFTPQDGSIKLDHEIESYDAATGTIVMWVKVPTLSYQNDTVLYIYYGNASIATSQQNKTGVWNDGGNNNFKGVWHLGESGSGSTIDYKDSTQYANNGGQSSNEPSVDISGKIGNAESFNGTGNYISVPTSASLKPSRITLAFWLKSQSTGSTQYVIDTDADGRWVGMTFQINGSRTGYSMTLGSVGQDPYTAYTFDNNWHRFVITYDGVAMVAYVDGVQQSSFSISGTPDIGWSSSPLIIGKSSTLYTKGSIDEMYIANITRSADWIKTEYNNQSNPTEFYSSGIEEAASPSNLSSWGYRKTITINHSEVSGGSSLTNFPVLVNFAADTDLVAHVQNDADDILFTSSNVAWSTGNQNDKLSHEIESYDLSSGSLQAWVKIPNLSNINDTVIYMYYGNANASNQQNKTAVWDNSSKLVQHMNQNPAGAAPQMTDSTQYGNNGTADRYSGGSFPVGQSVDGQISKALAFNSGSDYGDHVELGSSSSLNASNNMTVEAWINVSAKAQQRIVTRGWQSNGSFIFWIAGGYLRFQTLSTDGTQSTDAASNIQVPNNVWVHVVATLQPGFEKVYINGIVRGTVAITKDVTIGSGVAQLSGSSTSLEGSIDEVRISSTARSAAWIATEYANQNSPSSFSALSSEQSFMDHFTFTGATTQTAGSTQEITLTAIDTFGSTNTAYTGDKTITLSGANSIDSNTPTFTDKDNHEVNFGSSGTITFTDGIAHTTIKLYKAENAEIEASDGTYTTAGNVSYDLNVVVSLLGINDFDITSPSNITSETSFPLTLVAKDTYDNITTEVTNPTTLSVSDGAISTTSIPATDFQDDGTYSGTITISGIYQDKTIILTIRSGSITQTINLAVTGVSHPVGFISPLKPDLTGIRAFLLSGNLDANTIPQDIAQIAISSTPDFKDIAWMNFDKDKFIKIRETEGTLYLKFRTTQGAVSDTVTYTNNSNPNPTTLKEGDIVKTLNNPDVYVIKYKNNKQYKRLILSPNVFQSYRHLDWNNLKTISQEELNRYVTSNLVKETTDTIIYELFPNGDTGERKTFDAIKPYDPDSVYEINAVDRDSYVLVK